MFSDFGSGDYCILVLSLTSISIYCLLVQQSCEIDSVFVGHLARWWRLGSQLFIQKSGHFAVDQFAIVRRSELLSFFVRRQHHCRLLGKYWRFMSQPSTLSMLLGVRCLLPPVTMISLDSLRLNSISMIEIGVEKVH